MNILMLGDIVGSSGCEYARTRIPALKSQYGVQIVIANGENSADGNGISQYSAQFLFASGVDVITTGNHVYKRKDASEVLDRGDGVIRPANYHPSAPGMGYYVFDNLSFKLCVVNLQGCVYMKTYSSPFDCMDRLLKTIDTPNIIVDFHAEATAEKVCMGYYLDGKVSAVVGTHTHVPTNDARILKGGTGYITDIGMCGGVNSVLGIKPELALQLMRTNLPTKFETDTSECKLSGVLLDIDHKTGRCQKITSLVNM